MKLSLCLAAMLILCGCATVKTVSPSDIPGKTTADRILKADVLRMIDRIEKAQAPKCSYRIIDTKVVGAENSTVKEEWIVDSCGNLVVYPVSLTPDPKGGSFYNVQTPDSRVRINKK